jgi:hypothetical protein
LLAKAWSNDERLGAPTPIERTSQPTRPVHKPSGRW